MNIRQADPDENEIHRRCDEVQATWNPRTRRNRAGLLDGYGRRTDRWNLPVVAIENWAAAIAAERHEDQDQD